ncbi:BlaI/MecI/CopY family transcriptional regulator [candidate division KSB1 bacterium]|nr:BlaI/MecI/CopY family transcriptional regulator [candidate division KSB1 bacterium]
MKLSEAEWQVMNALWTRHPATARDLTEYLPENTSWAYTTLKTILTRLVAKQAVSERKRGNTSVYEPLITKSKARRNALISLLNQAFDGAVGPLMHFLVEEQKLTLTQRQELISLLQEEDKKREESND